MKPMKKPQVSRTFRVRLTPARDLTTGKAIGECQECLVNAASAVTVYAEQEGDTSVLALIDGAEAVVFTCPLDRLIDCVAVGNIVSERTFSAGPVRMRLADGNA